MADDKYEPMADDEPVERELPEDERETERDFRNEERIDEEEPRY